MTSDVAAHGRWREPRPSGIPIRRRRVDLEVLGGFTIHRLRRQSQLRARLDPDLDVARGHLQDDVAFAHALDLNITGRGLDLEQRPLLPRAGVAGGGADLAFAARRPRSTSRGRVHREPAADLLHLEVAARRVDRDVTGRLVEGASRRRCSRRPCRTRLGPRCRPRQSRPRRPPGRRAHLDAHVATGAEEPGALLDHDVQFMAVAPGAELDAGFLLKFGLAESSTTVSVPSIASISISPLGTRMSQGERSVC